MATMSEASIRLSLADIGRILTVMAPYPVYAKTELYRKLKHAFNLNISIVSLSHDDLNTIYDIMAMTREPSNTRLLSRIRSIDNSTNWNLYN